MGKTKVVTSKQKVAKAETVEKLSIEQKTRIAAILREEMAKMLSETQTGEGRLKDFSSMEDEIAGSMAEVYKKTIKRYRQEEAEAQM